MIESVIDLNANDEEGEIYIMYNDNYKENMYKVGRSNDSDRRVIEMSHPTGVPGKFHILKRYKVKKVKTAEKLIHEHLKEYRKGNKEFFEGIAYDKLTDEISNIVNFINQCGNIPPKSKPEETIPPEIKNSILTLKEVRIEIGKIIYRNSEAYRTCFPAYKFYNIVGRSKLIGIYPLAYKNGDIGAYLYLEEDKARFDRIFNDKNIIEEKLKGENIKIIWDLTTQGSYQVKVLKNVVYNKSDMKEISRFISDLCKKFEDIFDQYIKNSRT